jgi:predicted DNA-binding protein (UPF0251 family)
MGWRIRNRHGRRGRFPKPVSLEKAPILEQFTPAPQMSSEPIYIEPAELEAFRLIDLEGTSQEEAGERMGISRGTTWRLVQSARKKTAQALSEGRPIHVSLATSENNPTSTKDSKRFY